MPDARYPNSSNSASLTASERVHGPDTRHETGSCRAAGQGPPAVREARQASTGSLVVDRQRDGPLSLMAVKMNLPQTEP